MKSSTRSQRSTTSSPKIAGEYSQVDPTGIGLVSKHTIPRIGVKQWYTPSQTAGYHHIPTGALALSVLSWSIPPTSGFEGKQEVQETMEDTFNRLADTWECETEFLSSLSQITMNKSHLQIVAMGPDVVPLILKRMEHRPGLWFDALRFLTREDPVGDDIRGDIDAMTDAWLRWGRKHGYC